MRIGSRGLRAFACAVISTMLLAACDGDSTSSDSSFTLSLSPSPLQASYYYNDNSASVNVGVDVEVAGTVAVKTVYAVPSDSGNTFDLSSFSVPQPGKPQVTGPNMLIDLSYVNSRYISTLRVLNGLSVGAHSGNLKIRICADIACTSEFVSASLPYTITIKAPTLGMATSSIAVSGIAGGGVVLLPVVTGWEFGDPYLQADDPNGIFIKTQPTLMYNQGDGIHYTASMPVASDASATLHTGTVSLKLCGDADCKLVFDTKSYPYSLQVFKILAGQPGSYGSQDGSGSSALFAFAASPAVDAAGNLYVADPGFDIRKITPAGDVSTVFSITEAAVDPIRGLALGPSGEVYYYSFNDNGASAIYQVDSPSTSHYLSDSYQLGAMTVDAQGNFFAESPYGNPYQVFEISPDGVVRSILGEGSDIHAGIDIAMDSAENIYVIDSTTLYKLTPDGTLSNLATLWTEPKGSPNTISYDAAGKRMLVSIYGATDIYTDPLVLGVTLDGSVSTLVPAGMAFADGAIIGLSSANMGPDNTLYAIGGYGSCILETTLP